MLRRDMYWLGKDKTRFGPPYQFQLGFPCGSVGKNLPAIVGDADVGLIPELGRSSRGGNGNPLQYSCLENPMDRGAWVGYTLWGGLQSMGSQRVGHNWALMQSKSTSLSKEFFACPWWPVSFSRELSTSEVYENKRFPWRSVFLVFKSLRLAA